MKIFKYTFPLFLLYPSLTLSFDYFSNEIDYWKDQKKKPQVKKTFKKAPLKPKEKKGFSWKKHLDPNYEEFWTEGNHKTPAPVAEAAKVVYSDKFSEKQKKEAIKNYQKWISKKNELHKTFAFYLNKYSQNRDIKEDVRRVLKTYEETLSNSIIDQSKIGFTLYFKTNCSPCKAMLETFKDLHREGYYVEARQIEGHPFSKNSYPFVIHPTNKDLKEELLKSGIDSTPFTSAWIAGRDPISISGYQTKENLIGIINQEIQKGGGGK